MCRVERGKVRCGPVVEGHDVVIRKLEETPPTYPATLQKMGSLNVTVHTKLPQNKIGEQIYQLLCCKGQCQKQSFVQGRCAQFEVRL